MALDCGVETIHWTDLRVMLQIVEYKEYFFCLVFFVWERNRN